MNRLLILGGSDAGTSAALRAREVDSTAEVTVVMADRFPNESTACAKCSMACAGSCGQERNGG